MAGLDPALALLLKLKRRAWRRNLRRRLSTRLGLLFALVGFGVTAFWFLGAGLSSTGPPASPEGALNNARLLLTLIAVVLTGSAVLHRGLYLPADEIDRLFSAPLSRANLVRYRLLTSFGREIIFALFMGMALARRMPRAEFAFVGVLVTLWALTSASKGLSILLGDGELRWARLAAKVPKGWLRAGLGLTVWVTIVFLVMGDGVLPDGSGDAPPLTLASLMEHTWVRVLTWPVLPWALAIAANTWAEFLPAIGGCLILTVLLFEGAARLPVDFRELSLETSAEINTRMARAGGGVALSATKSRRRVPFLLGRTPFGAIVWLRLTSMVRRARGALVFSAIVMAIGIGVVLTGFSTDAMGPAILTLVGTVYLSSGLRFDFRSDLDRMSQVKAWPPAPWVVFLATLTPLVGWMCILIWVGLGVLVLAGAAGVGDAFLYAALMPFLAMFWVGVENVTFLLAPVRQIPGQRGAMQNTGRTLVLLFLRMTLLVLAGGAAWAAGFGGGLLVQTLGLGPGVETAVELGAAGIVSLALVAVVILAGGRALRHHDIAVQAAMVG